MSSQSKTLKLVIKNGQIRSIYDDVLVPLFKDAKSVNISNHISHVEPDPLDSRLWTADLAPVNGPLLRGFETRQAAVDAEIAYVNEHVIK